MKILHLEDNLRDAELIQIEHLEKLPDCRINVVSTEEDFVAQLADQPDLILSDFNMPRFNGLEALRLAREKAPEIPFIFLSGTIGEERAIEALRAGASDYVIKDRPKRLLPAIQRALKDAQLARERRAAEEQMHRVQRLENIGLLAAGIAHDFNNVLAPVLMGIPLLRMNTSDPSDQKILANIESSAKRGAGLVQQIMGFAQGISGEPQLIQPRHLISELVGILEQTMPKNIRVEARFVRELWPIRTNPTQLHQILLNLCVNARDAMPQGGVLTLRADNHTLDAMGAAAISGARPGDYLLIEVSDTGTGIPPAILKKIWDPFFTTKGAGKGTGLGLATVQGLVQSHQGVITLETQPGRGTTFRILLPAVPGAEGGSKATGLEGIPRGRGELVLVVDDDTSVRETTSAALRGHGYRTLVAADGTEALGLFAPRSLEVRAVVTDLDMPNLDGMALTKVVLNLNPSVRIILVSGSTDIHDSRWQVPPNGAFLPKPCSGEALLRTLHGLLNGQVDNSAVS
jgi:two-component system cell cycle sensor histidine kinase/response regulator CckA